MENNIIVSIQCLVYNHEPYLRQCLDGFVMQKTNFRFEAIVHDDVSTDGSAAIIREYAEKYPEIIKPIFEKENQYSKRDGSLERIMHEACKGKYIALCEGDDYWVDPLKLQKQVDFLEKNLEYGLVWSKAKKYNQIKDHYLDCIGDKASCFIDLIEKNSVVTLTAMVRRESIIGYYECIKGNKWLMGDYPMWLYIASKYKIKFINQTMGVYRILENSVSHGLSYKRKIEFIKSYYDIKFFFLNYLGAYKIIKKEKEKLYYDLFVTSFKSKKKSDVSFYYSLIPFGFLKIKAAVRLFKFNILDLN